MPRVGVGMDDRMEPQTTTGLIDRAAALGQLMLDQIGFLLAGLLRPWNSYQLVIALALFLLAHLLARMFTPRLQVWMRSREDWPKWRLRLLVLIRRRLR